MLPPEQDGWVRALDRLPEPGEQVLVLYEDDEAVMTYDPADELDWTHWIAAPPEPEPDPDDLEREEIDALERQARMIRDNLTPR